MSLRDLVHRDLIVLTPSSSILKAARLMRDQKIGSVFVCEGEETVGIVTDSDLVRKAFTRDLSSDTPVKDVMASPIIEIDIEKSVMDANHLMYFNEIRHLAVSEAEQIVGMISVRDIVHYLLSMVKGPMDNMREVLKPLTVLTHRNIYTIAASSTTREAAAQMETRKIGSLIVTEENEYAGIVTEADLVRKVVAYGLKASDIPVGVVMNTPIIDVDINASVETATELMSSKGIRHLGVRERGKIVGVLSIRDLIGMIAVRDLPRFFTE